MPAHWHSTSVKAAGPEQPAGYSSGMVRGVLIGVAATVAAGVLVFILVVQFGLIGVSAETKPDRIERWAARTSLHAAIAHGTAGVRDPFPLSDDNLRTGIKVYAANCAVCHGAADEKPSLIAQGLYLKPPQLAKDGVEDDPEAETFWKVSYGIRFTAMPGFRNHLSEREMWQVTQFLAHMDHLAPAVQADWQRVPSAAATPGA
jgi:thiosulfate dehydrogenase